MSPIVTFLLGLVILVLFGGYFFSENSLHRRILGSSLTVLLVALCLLSIWPPKDRIHLGLDLKGGTSFLIQLIRQQADGGTGAQISQSQQDQAVEVIRSRVDKFGVGEPVISPVGTDKILVQIPGLEAEKIAEAREQLQRVAKLEFRLVAKDSDAIVAKLNAGQPVVIPPGYRVETEEYPDPATAGSSAAGGSGRNSRYNALLNNSGQEEAVKKLTRKIVVKQKAEVLGDRVSSAHVVYDQRGWTVILNLDRDGARQFDDMAAAHYQERLAIVLDGIVQSSPVLQSNHYGGTASITGNFGEVESRNLASVLENPLQTPVKILEERSVSATLGTDSIKSGVFSGLAGLVLTFLFVLIYYRFAGAIACVALVVNVALLFGVISMFNFVLTLPGIAGIILTIGMAIDANVLIYERLREEIGVGKSLRAAVDSSFHKAFSSIFDANVTTLITSVILFYFATGPVKGFAVALTVGIIASLFSALVVTRNLFSWVLESGKLQSIKMLHFFPTQHFDFMGKSRTCILGSIAVILLSIGIFALRGEKNFGIDFKGGDLLVLATRQSLTADQVRSVLPPEDKESVVQITSQGGEQSIEVRSPAESGPKIEQALRAAFPAAGLEKRQAETVGALVGKQLAYKSLLAFGLGMLGILAYVSMRFEFSFAIGALVALFHDVIITIGVFALLGRELSLIMVGAVLTIAGYSINDTIVVYDRIRSGLREGRRGTVREIMNACINETLSRTVLTSGATLLTVVALFVGGGPVLNDFALAMLVGIVVGTYSSIFIASPIVLWFTRGHAHGDLRQQVAKPALSAASPSPAAASVKA